MHCKKYYFGVEMAKKQNKIKEIERSKYPNKKYRYQLNMIEMLQPVVESAFSFAHLYNTTKFYFIFVGAAWYAARVAYHATPTLQNCNLLLNLYPLLIQFYQLIRIKFLYLVASFSKNYQLSFLCLL